MDAITISSDPSERVPKQTAKEVNNNRPHSSYEQEYANQPVSVNVIDTQSPGSNAAPDVMLQSIEKPWRQVFVT